MSDFSKSYHLISIEHFTQKKNWDCGIACCKMVLSFLDKDLSSFDRVSENFVFNNSVWSIDLAMILAKLDVKHKLTTTYMGADVNHASKSYYRSNFKKDELRVNELFALRENFGLSIEKRSLVLPAVFQHIRENGPIIALIDSSKILCKSCDKTLAAQFSFATRSLKPFNGHFVLLVGYNMENSTIFYKNPSTYSEVCTTDFKTFDQARKAAGTDEDLILIYQDH